jgi:hypothetical protein
MRYIKGCISLNSEHDYPLLCQVLRSGFVAHDQLFEFMLIGKHESCRSTFNWRALRLTKYGLIARHTVPFVGKTFVYSVTPTGALELASVGERFLVTPGETSQHTREPQVAHALELNNIHLSLLRAGLLVRWVPEIQVRSRNSMMNFASAKDYDAVVTIRLEDRDVTFALEYERSAKSERQYAGISKKIESETDFDRFLYLASSEEVLRCVSWQFRNSKRYIHFGLLGDWYRHLLDTEVFDWIHHQYLPLLAALSSNTCPNPVPTPSLS